MDSSRWYERWMMIFLLLFLLYIPAMLISYPGTLMGDTETQIMQVFRGKISLHHPVLHTLLIHWFLLLGENIHSFNFGLFIYVLFQETILLSALTVCFVCPGISESRRRLFGLLFIAYYYLHPMVHRYMFLITKDVIYAAFFALFLFFLYQCIRQEKPGKACQIGMAGTGIGMILFRSEGKYALLVSLLVIAVIFRERRRIMLFQFLGMLLFSAFVFRILFPALSFVPVSRRESLSVPFQQTARYLRDHGEDVREEEKTAISAVLNYENLGQRYNPNISDPVKDTFRNEASTQELYNYVRAWAAMFVRHPGSYIQATINNYYQYFYPGKARFHFNSYSWALERMNSLNKSLEAYGRKLDYPEWNADARVFSDEFTLSLHDFPGFAILCTPAVYTWLLIIMSVYALHRRHRGCIALLVLPAVRLLLLCLGPTNGYYSRYSYPLIIAMPLLVLYYFLLLRDNTSKRAGNGAEIRSSCAGTILRQQDSVILTDEKENE